MKVQFELETERENSFNKIKRIKKYIDTHITEELGLDEIADKFGISKHYLCHLFKKNMGCTMLKYVKKRKLQLVQKYYGSGMNLLDASMKAGFRSYSDFYRTYRSEFGLSPRMHIDLLKEKS